ncbi:MAG TPA: ABC-F type ribosomal protection protein [Candidatus Merdenecus merdavium]|nr:ABC-F type ribosomal protection protein [Candidatus Merdenecus merdavium]
MSDIIVNQLSFSYDNSYHEIFKNVSLTINTDWKLGFIGRNGKGKTTFFQLLMGKYDYSGTITSQVEFEYFPFNIKNKSSLAIDVAKEIIAPYSLWEEEMDQCIKAGDESSMMHYGEIQMLFQEHDGYVIEEKIIKEMLQLKVNEQVLYHPFDTLSYGERTKVMLAALFLKKNRFLLIDEPTNHLDTLGRKQLAEYLNSKSGFILVSHDRAFIDSCVDHILSLNKQSIDIVQGNYSTWIENKNRKDQFEIQENEILKKDIDRLIKSKERTSRWSDQVESRKFGTKGVDRGHIGHVAAKMMKRSKSLENRQDDAIMKKKELLKDVEEIRNLRMNILPFPKNRMVELRDVTVAFGDHVILEDINLSILKGDRVAMKGKNGSGKSTLIKTILGEFEPTKGTCYVAAGLKIAYVSQDTSGVKGDLNEFIKNQNLDETVFKAVLRQMDFGRDQFEKSMEYYSQGQKKKILLAASLVCDSHLCIWDEPLNYVDILSRIQIENVLLKYKPTMIFVEHDQVFSDKISTKELLL